MTHNHLDLTTLLHERGARLTPQRQIILDALCATGGHVTVAGLYDRVHAQFPAIDRSTVYRALDFFVALGLVLPADVGGATVYEMAPREGGCCHPHLVCQVCGDVAHVPEALFHPLAARLAADYGFAAALAGLTISGRCRECAAAGAA